MRQKIESSLAWVVVLCVTAVLGGVMTIQGLFDWWQSVLSFGLSGREITAIGFVVFAVSVLLALHRERVLRLKIIDLGTIDSVCAQILLLRNDYSNREDLDYAIAIGRCIKQIKDAGGFRLNPAIENDLDLAMEGKLVVQSSPANPDPNTVYWARKPEYMFLGIIVKRAEEDLGCRVASGSLRIAFDSSAELVVKYIHWLNGIGGARVLIRSWPQVVSVPTATMASPPSSPSPQQPPNPPQSSTPAP